MRKIFQIISICLFLAECAEGQTLSQFLNQYSNANDTTSAYSIPPKMQWWYEARFGMFIHFGSYSHYGHGEWEMFLNKWSKEDYQNKITKKFNPKHFNAKEIVSLAKQAGMKYIIITAKHHEGFCMWNTQVDDFKDYTNTTTFDLYHYLGFERDLLMELKNECDKQGLKFGLYYSILDWSHHSQYAKDYWSQLYSMDEKAPFIEAEKRQIKELIDRYHPAVLWFDGDWCDNKDTADVFNWWTKQDAVDLYNYIMSIDSSIIVNERIKRNLGLGDFMCPEEKIPSKPLARPWETCRTMNGAWGYDKSKSSPKNYLTADQIFEELFMTASRDGNYLLNIGPKGNGKLSKGDKNTLRAVGSLMSVYGEAIYGTGRNPSPNGDTTPDGYTYEQSQSYEDKHLYTVKDGKLYCYSRDPFGTTWTPFIKIQHLESEKHTYKVYELSQPNQEIQTTACLHLKDTTIQFNIKNWEYGNYHDTDGITYDRLNYPISKRKKPSKKEFEIIVVDIPDFSKTKQ